MTANSSKLELKFDNFVNMHKEKLVLLDSMNRANDLIALYNFLSTNVVVPMSFDDILRYQTVHIVSAFDKLLHDVIRTGMVETFSGKRQPTDRYHSEPISISLHSQLIQASFPPKEVLFDQEIVRKLRHLSFQDPDKVVEGLSLIWKEKHKWQAICNIIGEDANQAKVRLKLIVGRRNAIVHEADIDPMSGNKTPIFLNDCVSNAAFLSACGCAIADLVV